MNWKTVCYCVLAAATLGVTRAEAQSCSSIFTAWTAAEAAGKSVWVDITTSQANKISTSTRSIHVTWDSLTSHWSSFPYPGNQAPMRFNDRLNSSYANQNLSTESGDTEDIDLDIWISGGVTSASIHNLVWGNYLTISTITCTAIGTSGLPEHTIMTGLGTAIGNGNSGRSAMYAISYRAF